jgi:hypothetical protein
MVGEKLNSGMTEEVRVSLERRQKAESCMAIRSCGNVIKTISGVSLFIQAV